MNPPDPFIDADGNQYWYVNGRLHREDGPAAIYADGSRGWHVNGSLHRIGGPTYIYADGSQVWYVNGKPHFSNKSYQKAAKLSDEDMTMIVLQYGKIG